MRRVRGLVAIGLAFCLSCAWAPGALAADCNAPAAEAVTHVKLDGHPFAAIPAADGCTIFVSLTGARNRSALAVLTRADGKVTVAHTLNAEGGLTGMALSPDGHYLAAANGSGISLFDTGKLTRGEDKPLLGYLQDGGGSGAVYAAFSPDGDLLVVSDERSMSLSVYDFAAVRAGKTAKMVGQVRTGGAPVGLAFSPDGKLLYSTSEVVRRGDECKGENGAPSHGPGGIEVIDAVKARTDPAGAVLVQMNAGCEMVRIVLSADGATAYASARGEDTLWVIDTARLTGKVPQPVRAKVKVGTAPVGVAVAGDHVFVTNSDRFGKGQTQTVSVVNAADPTAPLLSLPAGGFPRELRVTADGKTLLVTNFTSQTLELVDLARLDQVK